MAEETKQLSPEDALYASHLFGAKGEALRVRRGAEEPEPPEPEDPTPAQQD